MTGRILRIQFAFLAVMEIKGLFNNARKASTKLTF